MYTVEYLYTVNNLINKCYNNIIFFDAHFSNFVHSIYSIHSLYIHFQSTISYTIYWFFSGCKPLENVPEYVPCLPHACGQSVGIVCLPMLNKNLENKCYCQDGYLWNSRNICVKPESCK